MHSNSPTQPSHNRKVKVAGVCPSAIRVMPNGVKATMEMSTTSWMRLGMLASCGGGLLSSPAQHRPIHVRTQVFAAHGAVGGTLNGGTSLSGHLSLSARPLGNKDRWRSD